MPEAEGGESHALVSGYVDFDARRLGAAAGATPLTLGEADLAELHGINERVSLARSRGDLPAAVAAAQPVRRRHADAAQGHRHVSRQPARAVPYVIGIAGSVAVGKSTFARILQALLARWPDHPRVDLVTTDGFLLPEPRARRRAACMQRKGFPGELRRPRAAPVHRRRQGRRAARHAPVYSHQSYDIVAGESRSSIGRTS